MPIAKTPPQPVVRSSLSPSPLPAVPQQPLPGELEPLISHLNNRLLEQTQLQQQNQLLVGHNQQLQAQLQVQQEKRRELESKVGQARIVLEQMQVQKHDPRIQSVLDLFR